MSTPTTRFGRTGLVVPRLVLGTMTFGGQADEAVSHAILDKAHAAGCTFIDTADMYPLGGTWESAGGTETIIGNWLAKGGAERRRGVVLATKAVLKVGPNPWDAGASRVHLLDAIDRSLARLRTDHVELYQLHMDDRETPPTSRWRRSTRSFAPAGRATSASPTSWPGASPARSAAPNCCAWRRW